MTSSMADPGFPRGGGANPRGGGAPTYDFAKFSQKLHELKESGPGGGGGLARPLHTFTDLVNRVGARQDTDLLLIPKLAVLTLSVHYD